MKIALAGNPNCGKTTLFNSLTGSKQYVGNWPGVTVEKKEGKLKGYDEVSLLDLPGIYSLSPYSLEEVVARDYLVNEQPDVLMNIVDGTNIERNLYLTTQLLELGIPTLVVINMMDLVIKNQDKIDLTQLSTMLGCPVIEASALKGTNLDEVSKLAVSLASQSVKKPLPLFTDSLEKVLTEIEALLPKNKASFWMAVKLFERDQKIHEQLQLDTSALESIEALIQSIELVEDDDSESIIANQRYSAISKIVSKAVTKHTHQRESISDRIDKVLTNRWLALPIFALVMILVYYLSITSIGTLLTDFTNDVLFGEWILPNLESWLNTMNVASWLVGVVVEGIVGGVGAVLGFVPQMMVLFLMLSILEDCGYMARVAFIMDRVFRKFGLSGKSFIPMLIGSGCSVPGIMASRTIEQDRDRKMTIMTTSFIPCSAKMPIIGLIAGALFNEAWWVAPTAYFIGVAAVIISGIILKKTRLFAGDPAPFVMELPAYHVPSTTNVFRSVKERSLSFIKKAGTIILISSVILYFLQAFGWVNGALQMVEDNNTSLLAAIGRTTAFVFVPLGFGNWQATVGTITGLIAKENLVSTLGILYGFSEVAETGSEYWSLFALDFTALSAFSFMIFNLLCAPCFAAMGAIKREMNNTKWTIFAITYLCVFAYSISFIVYQVSLFIQTGIFGLFTGLAMLLLVILLYLLVRKPTQAKKTI